MRLLISGLLAFWTVLLCTAYINGGLQPPYLAAAIGASVTVGVAYANRLQSAREAVLSLHKEYYSHSFGLMRHKAGQFIDQYASEDWATVNPFELADPHDTLSGYAEILRFWHRVAVLYENGALDRSLTQRLLSRELGYWFGFIFEQMAERRGMYTKPLLFELRRKIEIGEGSRSYHEGYSDGVTRRRLISKPTWVRTSKRWTNRQVGKTI